MADPLVSIRRAPTYPDPTSRMARTGRLEAPRVLTFSELCHLLVSSRRTSEYKTDVGCWTPISFAEDRRIKADATALTALVFDLDQPPDGGPLIQGQVDEDFARLRAAGAMWFAHTSYSYGCTEDAKGNPIPPKVAWRLLVPLDTWLLRAPQESAEHFALRARWVARRFIELVGIRCVHELSDLGRIWFWPGTHPDRLVSFSIAGQLVDVKPAALHELLAGFKEPTIAPAKLPTNPSTIPPDRAYQGLDILRRHWPDARNALGISRHKMRLGLVGILAMAGYDDDAIADGVAYVYSAVGDDAEYKTLEAITHTRHCIEQGANVLTWGGLREWFAAIGKLRTLEHARLLLTPWGGPADG